MLFKDISYLELWQPFYSTEENHLCNFGRGHYEEHFCEVILNLDQWFRKKCCKTFDIYSSGGSFVQHNGTLCSFGQGHIMRNISVKLI